MFIYNGKEYDKVWFTSDEHYGSDRHITLSCRLPFIDVEKEAQIERYEKSLDRSDIPEQTKRAMLLNAKHSIYGSTYENPVNKMNNTFIENHNKRVGDNDIVFHLGDFGDYEYAKYLNGHHVLLLGNYEFNHIKDTFNDSFDAFRHKITSTYNFIDVLRSYTLHSGVNINFNTLSDEVYAIFMTHQPRHCWYDYERNEYIKYYDKIYMNLFGHIHEKCKIKRCGLNVGVDAHHFYPVSQEEVEFYLYSILHYYDKDVFC